MVDTIVRQFYGKRPIGLEEMFLLDLHYVLDHPQLEVEDIIRLELACSKCTESIRDLALSIIRKKYLDLMYGRASLRRSSFA
jgi:hypothetical protein